MGKRGGNHACAGGCFWAVVLARALSGPCSDFRPPHALAEPRSPGSSNDEPLNSPGRAATTPPGKFRCNQALSNIRCWRPPKIRQLWPLKAYISGG